VEAKPANHWFHTPWQIIVASFCTYWYWHPPVPNKAVLVLTGVTVVMALLDMSTGHKAVYLLLVICLMFIENRAINKDRADTAAAESQRRAAENIQFQSIANGVTASIQQNQQQFQATMQQAGKILGTTQQVGKLAEENLQNVTGGDSFAYAVPQGGGPTIPLVLHNWGNNILSGVSITVASMQDPNWGNAMYEPITIGTIAPHGFASVPTPIAPSLDSKSGIGSFWIFVYAQNGMVDEMLQFRQSKKYPNTLAYSFTVTRHSSLIGWVSRFLVREA
jgi:hypothetical protein